MTVLGNLVINKGIQTGPFGSQLHASDYTDTGVGVVMPQDIGNNVINTSKIARIDAGTADSLHRHELISGDIVLSRRGDVTRRALVRSTDNKMICGTGCLRVRINRDIANPEFIYYQMALPEKKEWLIRHAVGATMANLNTKILSSLPIELPSLKVQKSISKTLGALDNKIDSNQRIINLGLNLLDSIYLHSPKKRSASSFEEVAEISGGGTPSTKISDYWGGVHQWATPSDITALDGPWLTKTERTITDAGIQKITSKMNEPGSILMTSRASIGHCALSSEPTAVNQGFIVVNAKNLELQPWLFAQLRHRTKEFIAWANGATFLELPKGVFKKLPVDLPLEDVKEFSSRAWPILKRIELAQKENQTLAATRDELLPLLMSGKITVKDAEKRVEDEV